MAKNNDKKELEKKWKKLEHEEIKEIVNDSFQNIDKLCMDLVEGKIEIA